MHFLSIAAGTCDNSVPIQKCQNISTPIDPDAIISYSENSVEVQPIDHTLSGTGNFFEKQSF